MALNKTVALCDTLTSRDGLVNADTLLDCMSALMKELGKPGFKANKAVDAFLKRYRDEYNKLEKHRVSTADFTDIEILGKGAFGEVKLVRNNVNEKVYAMKCINKTELLGKIDGLSSFWEERYIMAHANSDWIVKLYWAFQDLKNIYMVMDFMPGGDLMTLVSNDDVDKSEEFIRFYMAETVLAIEVLHGMGYAHRDIKPDNCLIDHRGHLKVTDFGTTVRVDDRGLIKAETAVGTPDYISPEVLKSQGHPVSYGRECDWWSLGVMIYELKYADTPFYSDHLVETYSRITKHKDNLEFPPDEEDFEPASPEIMDLINKCLISDPPKRLGAKGARELKVHPFFIQNSKWTWENIHTYPPPFDPKISSETDTHNFDYEPSDEGTTGGLKFRNDLGAVAAKSDKVDLNILPFVGFSHFPEMLTNLSAGSVDSGAGDGKNTKKQLEDALKNIDKLKNSYNQAEASREKLDNEFREQQKKQTMMSIENTTLTKKFEDMCHKYREISSQSQTMKQDLDALKSENKKLKSATGDKALLEKELTSKNCLSQELATEKIKSVEAEKKVQEAEKMMKELHSKLNRLREENSKVTEDLRIRQEEFETVYNELSNAQYSNTTLEESVKQLSEETKKLSEDKDSLHNELSSKGNEISNKMRENEQLKLEKEHLLEKIEDANLEIESLNQKKATNDDEQEELTTVKKQLHQEQDAKKNLLNKLHTVEQENATLKFDLEKSKKANESMAKQKEDLTARCFKIATTIESVKTENARLIKDLRLKTSEAETFKNKEGNSHKEVQAIKESKKHLEEEIDRYRNEIASYDSKLRDMEDEVTSTQLKMKLDKNTIDNLNEDSEELTKLNEDLQTKCEEFESAKLALEKQVSEKDTLILEIDNKLLLIDQKLQLEKCDYESKIEKLKADLEKRNQDIVDLRNSVEDLKSEKGNVEAKMREIESAKLSVEEDLAKSKQDYSKMETKLSTEKSQLIKKLADVVGIKEVNAKDRDGYVKASKQYGSKSADADLKKREKAAKTKEQALKAQEGVLAAQAHKMAEEKQDLLNELTAIKEELNAASQRANIAEANLRQYSKERDNFRSIANSSLNDSMASLCPETFRKEGRLHTMISARVGGKPRKGQSTWSEQFVILEAKVLLFFNSKDDCDKKKEPRERVDLNQLLVVKPVTSTDVRDKPDQIPKIFQLCYGDENKKRLPDPNAFDEYNGHVFKEYFSTNVGNLACDICSLKFQTAAPSMFSKGSSAPIIECKYCKKKLHKELYSSEKAKVHKCPASNKFETTLLLLMASDENDQKQWIRELSKFITHPVPRARGTRAESMLGATGQSGSMN